MKCLNNGVYVVIDESPSAALPVIHAFKTDGLQSAKAKLHAIIKKQIVNVINNNPAQFDEDLVAFLTQFKDKWYNEGLKAMDKMHGLLENKKD